MRLISCVVAAAAVLLPALPGQSPAARLAQPSDAQPSTPQEEPALRVYPPAIGIDDGRDRQRVTVLAQSQDGASEDLTARAEWRVEDQALARSCARARRSSSAARATATAP